MTTANSLFTLLQICASQTFVFRKKFALQQKMLRLLARNRSKLVNIFILFIMYRFITIMTFKRTFMRNAIAKSKI